MSLDIRANKLGGVGLRRLANTICAITHTDMQHFVLHAENNGLENVSDFDEQAFWQRVFTPHKKNDLMSYQSQKQ